MAERFFEIDFFISLFSQRTEKAFEVRHAWSGEAQAVNRVKSIYRLFDLIKNTIDYLLNIPTFF